MPVYQPLIPTGTVNLDVDYQNIQGNFEQANISFGIDHLPFSNLTAQNGYHTAIHFNPVSTTTTNPPNNQPINGYTATPGYGQLFSAQINDGINTDEALYFLSGGGRLTQLTRNFQPAAVTLNNGYTFLPGGIIFQWGIVTAGAVGQFPVSFATSNIDFPNNCFNVSLTPICKVGGTTQDHVFSVEQGTVSATGFTYNSTATTTYPQFFWTAIGN
ncbi:hypothetical protein UFOVP264_14 [uncultured Caudovirales phage]|uniref:Putative tail fiber protein gp53-like C-terminal domain-containing protein n=1 Tax=uncultured Caudovirales phage TaxID=2100421 RepID=A0A6J5LJM1_9CAUD|nr:hypothetical protein UFOVP264_14 [uncultured Caudovirales phage]